MPAFYLKLIEFDRAEPLSILSGESSIISPGIENLIFQTPAQERWQELRQEEQEVVRGRMGAGSALVRRSAPGKMSKL